MSLIHQLSSQVHDRSEYSNRKVVCQCLEEPTLIEEIAAGLQSKDAGLVGDCAEVLTQIAETRPEWIEPYAHDLASLLAHPKTRVRWEAMHGLALVASRVPKVMRVLLPQLGELIRSDASVIVRDYAVDALAAYATTSPQAARAAYPYLVEALTTWNGKQAGHALKGLIGVVEAVPRLAPELNLLGQQFHKHPRQVVRQAAQALLKATEKKPSK